MFTEQRRYGQDPDMVRRTGSHVWRDPYRWQKKGMASGTVSRVFTCSWSDFFHPEADEWRAEAWQVIGETPALTYQILTKRPGRIRQSLPQDWQESYGNCWLGVSVETKDWLWRIQTLRNIPARMRFVSFEPLLEDVGDVDLTSIQWAIIGGESGPARRPMNIAWMVALYEQCRAQGVAVYIKQNSVFKSGQQGNIP